MRRTNTMVAGAVGAAAVVGLAFVGTGAMAQQGAGARAGGGQAGGQGAGQGAPTAQDMGGRLIAGLMATPGCLGVDAGDMMSGKNVIIAWFENKAAAVRWYHSDTHQGMMRAFIKEGTEYGRKPMEHVTDETTPVMVIASITPSEGENVAGMSLPISQIAIELFAPLPGGAFVNSRLSPEGFKVEHMRDYTPRGE